MVEIFLWLQNHFLGNRFEPKIFIKNFFGKNFYDCKVISSEIGLNQKYSLKFFERNFFMVWISFPRKKVWTKYFHQNFLVENFYGCKIIYTKPLWTKNCHQKFLFENFLLCKIISSKTGLTKKLSKFFGRKFFLVATSFPRK